MKEIPQPDPPVIEQDSMFSLRTPVDEPTHSLSPQKLESRCLRYFDPDLMRETNELLRAHMNATLERVREDIEQCKREGQTEITRTTDSVGARPVMQARSNRTSTLELLTLPLGSVSKDSRQTSTTDATHV